MPEKRNLLTLTYISSLIIVDTVGQVVPIVKTQYLARCTTNFCDELTEIICPELPPKCDNEKEDFFGWESPSPDVCNCCPYCIAYLGLDEICPIGQPTGISPTHMCGPGLYCSLDKKTGKSTCKNMVDVVKLFEEDPVNFQKPEFDIACSREQLYYDRAIEQGQLGNLQVRPACDENGKFSPYRCIPGEICYCQDELGNRIFGEIPYNSLASSIMHCGCSRHNTKAARKHKDSANTWSQMRCLPDGSFDPIQCLEAGCLCVDKQDGMPTYPDRALVNVTEINEGNMDCFDKEYHIANDYYHVCEDIFIRNYIDDLRLVLEGYDLYGATYVHCQMDGKYARIQSNNEEIYCADPAGAKIEHYGILLANVNEKDKDSINCNCARANLIIPGLEKPKCCRNGNYDGLQCRRGECRCVDENGNQIEKEVSMEDVKKLSCYPTTCKE